MISGELTFGLSTIDSSFLTEVIGEPSGAGPGKDAACCHTSFGPVVEEPKMPAGQGIHKLVQTS